MEIRIADWNTVRDTARKIRSEVFIREQGVPEELEWDDADATATHIIAYEGRSPVGCARLLPDGHFGRMAVLPTWRNEHWGSRILHALENYARTEMKLREIKASAQTRALPFYQKNGFSTEAGFFDDAGMPHVHIYKAPGGENGNHVLRAGEDDTLYRLESLTAMSGWCEAALAQRPRRVILMCDNLRHPLWSRSEFVDAISRYARSAHQRHVDIYLPSENGSVLRHPLMRLQSRMNSRISLHVHPGVSTSLLLMPEWGYLRLAEQDLALANMGDRPGVVRLQAEYSEILNYARPSREGRRLAI